MIFSETEKDFTLHVDAEAVSSQLNDGLWLVMANAYKIPPHIALIHNGEYYSATVKKVNVGVPIESFLTTINRRSVPCLFVKFKNGSYEANGSRTKVKNLLHEGFSACTRLGEGDHTCITPISNFFSGTISDKYGEVMLVFELLALAHHDGIIDRVTHLNARNRGKIQLRKYSVQDVRNEINSLNNAIFPSSGRSGGINE